MEPELTPRRNAGQRARMRRLVRRPSAAGRALVFLLAWLAWLSPLPLRAQEDPQRKAAAEALFNEGQKLLFHGEYDEARRRFEQSQALDSGVGTLLYLAQCYERLGRSASAWATYSSAYSLAKANGQAERARVANERASRLEPTLAKLTVTVAAREPSEGFALTFDGKPLEAALINVPFPVDPGRYQLVARAFARTPWSTSIEIQAGQAQTVQVPVLEPAPVAEQLPGTDPYAGSAQGVAPLDRGAAFSPRQKASLIVAAGGVAAIATGVVLGLVAQSKDHDSTAACASSCVDTRRAEDLNESARDWALGANIAYGIGALGLITGGALYFWPDDDAALSPSRSVLGISPRVGPDGALLTIGGVL
jgi:tetratricopeptide (TPR) repeat protein